MAKSGFKVYGVLISNGGACSNATKWNIKDLNTDSIFELTDLEIEDDASDAYKFINDKDLFSNISESSILRRESNDQIRGISLMQQILNTFDITISDLLAILITPKEHLESDVRYHLTTMHGSKGLEWDNVILIGLEDKHTLDQTLNHQ